MQDKWAWVWVWAAWEWECHLTSHLDSEAPRKEVTLASLPLSSNNSSSVLMLLFLHHRLAFLNDHRLPQLDMEDHRISIRLDLLPSLGTRSRCLLGLVDHLQVRCPRVSCHLLDFSRDSKLVDPQVMGQGGDRTNG